MLFNFIILKIFIALVYSFMSFKTFLGSCNHHTIPPKYSLILPLYSDTSIPPITHDPFSIAIVYLSLNVKQVKSYLCNPLKFVSLTKYNVFEIHPSCCLDH